MKRIIILLLAIIQVSAFGQVAAAKHALDSLNKRILQVHDTAFINTLYEIGYNYKVLNELDSVDACMDRELRLSRDLHYKRGIANATYMTGLNYRARGNYPKSKEFLESSMKLRQEMYDSTGSIDDLRNLGSSYNALGLVNYNMGSYIEGMKFCNKAMKVRQTVYSSTKSRKDNGLIAQVQNNMGIIYFDLGNYTDALNCYVTAMQVYMANKDSTGIALLKGNIGNIYLRQKDYSTALRYEQEALALSQKLGDTRAVAQFYTNVGSDYHMLKDTAASRFNYDKAFEIRQQLQDEKGVAVLYGLYANLKLDADDYPAAERFYDMAIDIHRKQNDRNSEALNLINESTCFYQMKDFKRSMDAAQQGLDISLDKKMMENVMLAYQILARDDSATGDFRSAFLDYRKYLQYADSLASESNSREIVSTQMTFEFDNISAQEQAERDKTNAVAAAEKSRKKIQLYFAGAGFILILLGAIVVSRSYRRKKKANIEMNLQTQILEEKQKEILDSIRYAKRIQQSLLPTEKYIEKNLRK